MEYLVKHNNGINVFYFFKNKSFFVMGSVSTNQFIIDYDLLTMEQLLINFRLSSITPSSSLYITTTTPNPIIPTLSVFSVETHKNADTRVLRARGLIQAFKYTGGLSITSSNSSSSSSNDKYQIEIFLKSTKSPTPLHPTEENAVKLLQQYCTLNNMTCFNNMYHVYYIDEF